MKIEYMVFGVNINLPLVQQILNYTVNGSVRTRPEKDIFGDLKTSDIERNGKKGKNVDKIKDNMSSSNILARHLISYRLSIMAINILT